MDTPPAETSWWTKMYGSYGDYKPFGDYTSYDKLKFEDIKIYNPDLSGAVSDYSPWQTNLPQNTWGAKKTIKPYDFNAGYTPMFTGYMTTPVFTKQSAFSPFKQN